MKEWTSEKSLLTLSSLRSSISHYCPLIDFHSLIYGRKKMSQWNGLLIKLFNRFWAINPDLYIQVVSYFHILVSSIKGCQMRHLINNFTIFWALWGKSNIYISRKWRSHSFILNYRWNKHWQKCSSFSSNIGIRATVVHIHYQNNVFSLFLNSSKQKCTFPAWRWCLKIFRTIY